MLQGGRAIFPLDQAKRLIGKMERLLNTNRDFHLQTVIAQGVIDVDFNVQPRAVVR